MSRYRDVKRIRCNRKLCYNEHKRDSESLLTPGERQMSIMNEIHDIVFANDVLES